jgi:replicative DNA helicase
MTNQYEFDRNFRVKILACLLDPVWYSTYTSIIKPEYFPNEDESDFVTAVDKYHEQYSRIPSDPYDLEILATSPDSIELMHTVFDTYEQQDLFLAGDKAIEFAKQQAVKLAILQSVDDIDTGDLSQIVDRMKEALEVGTEIDSLGLDPYVDVDKWLYDYWKDKIKTGWMHIDGALEGGLAPGELGVILSPQNRGKSMSLINIGFGAAAIGSGKNVVHITHEMSVAQTAKRYAARTIFRFPRFDDDLDDYSDELYKAAHRLVTGSIRIIGSKDVTKNISHMGVSDIRAKLCKLQDSGFKIDLLIDDYADLLKPSRKFSDRRFELSDIYQALRELAKEFECPVWTASQSRRSSHTKEIITMEDIAEDINKVSIADVVISLCQTKEEKDSDQCRLFTAKVRDGISGMTFGAKFYPKQQAIITTGWVKKEEIADV